MFSSLYHLLKKRRIILRRDELTGPLFPPPHTPPRPTHTTPLILHPPCMVDILLRGPCLPNLNLEGEMVNTLKYIFVYKYFYLLHAVELLSERKLNV